MLVTLILYTCLMTEKNMCDQKVIDFNGSLHQCALFGQLQAEEFLRYHPKRYLKKYRCTMETSDAI